MVVQSNTGKLFSVNARTGVTDEIELAGGETVVNGDGILLDGKKLYVVRNQNNEVAVVQLGHRLDSGRIVARLTDPALDIPTTIAEQRQAALRREREVHDPADAGHDLLGRPAAQVPLTDERGPGLRLGPLSCGSRVTSVAMHLETDRA